MIILLIEKITQKKTGKRYQLEKSYIINQDRKIEVKQKKKIATKVKRRFWIGELNHGRKLLELSLELDCLQMCEIIPFYTCERMIQDTTISILF